jgi:hypothetical protein
VIAKAAVETSTEPGTVAVIIADPFLITIDGTTHEPGKQLDVPDDERTAAWLRCGWVIRA